MFERRERTASSLGFNHVHRHLQADEQIPALPGLTEQIRACRHEMARGRRLAPAAEPAISAAADDLDDEGYYFED